MIKLHSAAPKFSLEDDAGKVRTLQDYAGKWLLIYFYPKDDTPGCTKEACTIRDVFPKFKKLPIEVVGVSTDSVASHQKFKAKYKLPFTLLADVDKMMVNDYEVWAKKKFMGREYFGVVRSSFLINPEGKIAKIYETVKPAEHAQEVLHDLQTLIKK